MNRPGSRRALSVGLTIAAALLLVLTSGATADAGLRLHSVAAQAEPCQAETKRLNAFKRKMDSRRRAFFRSHRSRKQRRAFVTKQANKLKELRRARSLCLRNAAPPPPAPSLPPPAPSLPPPASPFPPAPDTTSPELRIVSPGAGAWFDQPTATVEGSARDPGSGISRVSCNGQAATRNGDNYSCQVGLSEGSNTIGITASDAAGNTSAAGVVVKHAPGGVAGEASATALGAVKNVDTDPRHEEAEVSTSPEGQRIARKEIALRITPSATVGQVNAALQSVDGKIVGSVAGWPGLAVGIPDPGSLDALDALLATLRTLPGVDSAERADMPATDQVPPGFTTPLSPGNAGVLSHLIALRMPAAWNARGAIELSDRPTMIVADMFGNGPLSAQVDAPSYNSGDLLVRPGPNEHGYHVVGIAASGFTTNGTAAGNVTGVFPASTPLHVIDAVGISTQMTGLKIFQKATALTGHVVVNTSLGSNPAPADSEAQEYGSDWARLVRSSTGLEDRMLHATSAGNSAAPANRNSSWAAAALRSDLTNQFDLPMTALRNTLAVENLVDTGAPDFEPGCLGTTSNRSGNIAAVGTDVFSHRFGSLAGDKTGTSMASPQVAALGMFLWSIEPSLTAPQLRDLMIATSRDPLSNEAGRCGTDLPSSPRLDAYSAVLGLDQPTSLTPHTAPVRHAILDHDGDGTFDEDDLGAFSAVSRDDAGDRDWSRADLNGDGFTGGTPKAPMDLDPTGSSPQGKPKLEKVHQEILGVSVEFDEENVTDMEALCYFAFSGLYEGSEDQRTTSLDPVDNCGAEAEFSNGKIVMVGRSPRGPGQLFPPPRLWFVEPPGDPVAFTPEGEGPGDPAWSPDGQRIAYVRGGSQPGIWITGANGLNASHVAGTGEHDRQPTWSPDGQRIAFSRDFAFEAAEAIHIVDAAGGTPTPIPGTEHFADPSWSPDGTRIAAQTPQYDIATFAPDGQNLVNLTNNHPVEEYAPDWSPAGRRLVFTSNRPIASDPDTRLRLWFMDANGSNVTLFTTPFGSNQSGTIVQDFEPSWSPDGHKVTFARSHQNGSRFVMTKDLGASASVPVTPLPSDTTDHTFQAPDWQPIPIAP